MALPSEGWLSLRWFLQGAGIVIVPLLHKLVRVSDPAVADVLYIYLLVICGAYVTVNFAVLFVLHRRKYYRQIAAQACFIGVVFGIGLSISFLHQSIAVFGWYLCVLGFFHFSEYFSTSIYNYESLSVDSFLLNHSVAYVLAAVSSWCEFFLELYFFPDLKQWWYVSLVGLVLCVGGEFLRKVSMLTAGKSFNHYIQTTRARDHVLVTHGVYAWSRHPSYVGWFYWSIGTQIILCNPLCFVAYAITSWRFFNERIEDEEITLLNFFGEEYLNYQQRVGTRLPFIKGYKMEL
ncbi:protein-S-isoprenylcysteine O-methyltransferase-like isoform X1 [Acanthaster planci]|uniref:Protein-S-isoprenylcysteine O-methyltransferase n=1 Tax=Acanthaster planci TaxID=133434 RepID=A0A8B8A1U6_ACAPL|nr:protein-S-isoprenylcysteine O-methyltransferase-like isoform X1 [Acanthaster planci]